MCSRCFRIRKHSEHRVFELFQNSRTVRTHDSQTFSNVFEMCSTCFRIRKHLEHISNTFELRHFENNVFEMFPNSKTSRKHCFLDVFEFKNISNTPRTLCFLYLSEFRNISKTLCQPCLCAFENCSRCFRIRKHLEHMCPRCFRI